MKPPFILLVCFAILLGALLGGWWAMDRAVRPAARGPVVGQQMPSAPATPTPDTQVLEPGSIAEPVPTTPESAAHLLFVGDIMLDRGVRLRSVRAGTRAYPFAKLPFGLAGES
jgi:hypothetical protein